MEQIKTFNTLKGSVKTFSDLIGRTLYKVTADDDEMVLYLSDTNYVRFYHQQDCCESVCIDDICGDLNDLVGEPLLMAEEVSNVEFEENYKPDYEAESYTWTFYKFATRKGYVDVRWFGESNGYYSERVSVDVVDDYIEYNED